MVKIGYCHTLYKHSGCMGKPRGTITLVHTTRTLSHTHNLPFPPIEVKKKVMHILKDIFR